MASDSPFGDRVEPVFPLPEAPDNVSYTITFVIDGEQREKVVGGGSRRDDLIAQLTYESIAYEVIEN